MGDYNVYLGFHSKRDFLFPFYFLSFFLFFLLMKIYCVKCRRLTETEQITIASSKNGRLMKRGQCIKCGKLRLNSSKLMLPVEVFLIL